MEREMRLTILLAVIAILGTAGIALAEFGKIVP
jgi:hypothetical protein